MKLLFLGRLWKEKGLLALYIGSGWTSFLASEARCKGFNYVHMEGLPEHYLSQSRIDLDTCESDTYWGCFEGFVNKYFCMGFIGLEREWAHENQQQFPNQPLLSDVEANHVLVSRLQLPKPLGGSKSRSASGFHKLHRRSIGAQNCGIYFLDPRGALVQG